MIAQKYGYILNQKRKYLKHTLIWGIIVAVIFFSGLLILKKRETYFTVMSGVMVMGVALNLSRYIGYSRFKDGNKDYANVFDNIKIDNYIFHSAIIPNVNNTAFFENIIVTNNNIYFIAETEERSDKYRLMLENVLKNKGIALQNILFYYSEDIIQVEKLVKQIEVNDISNMERLEEYKRIVENLLM